VRSSDVSAMQWRSDGVAGPHRQKGLS